MGNLEFNANDHEPSTKYEPIPEGIYQAVIDMTEMKATKSGNGEYLQIKWTIIEGEQKGRTVTDRLNLDNPNEKAVKIANSTLSAICRAVEHMKLNDHEELRGHTAEIEVYIEEQPGYGPGNKIGEYRKSEQNQTDPFEEDTSGGDSTPF